MLAVHVGGTEAAATFVRLGIGSAAALTGGVGHAAYAAANLRLMRIAEMAIMGIDACVILWSRWRGTGAAATHAPCSARCPWYLAMPSVYSML